MNIGTDAEEHHVVTETKTGAMYLYTACIHVYRKGLQRPEA